DPEALQLGNHLVRDEMMVDVEFLQLGDGGAGGGRPGALVAGGAQRKEESTDPLVERRTCDRGWGRRGRACDAWPRAEGRWGGGGVGGRGGGKVGGGGLQSCALSRCFPRPAIVPGVPGPATWRKRSRGAAPPPARRTRPPAS